MQRLDNNINRLYASRTRSQRVTTPIFRLQLSVRLCGAQTPGSPCAPFPSVSPIPSIIVTVASILQGVSPGRHLSPVGLTYLRAYRSRPHTATMRNVITKRDAGRNTVPAYNYNCNINDIRPGSRHRNCPPLKYCVTGNVFRTVRGVVGKREISKSIVHRYVLDAQTRVCSRTLYQPYFIFFCSKYSSGALPK